MKAILTTVGILALVHFAGAQGFVSSINGSQEVPTNSTAVDPFVIGSATFTLSGNTLTCTSGSCTISGSQTVVTVNDGAPGSNGPIVFDLTILNVIDPVAYTTFSFDGSGTLTTQQIADLNAGDLYVNIPSLSYPDGEIRGEILPVPEPTVAAFMGTGTLMLLGLARRKKVS